MKTVLRYSAFVTATLWTCVVYAQPSAPQSIFSLSGSHCQIPKWSPDGKEVAIELFAPKKDAREVVIVEVSDRNQWVKDRKVGAGRSRAGALLGS